MPDSARHQHEHHIRQVAERLKKNLGLVLDDLAHHRPLSVDGWQFAIDGLALYGQMTALDKHHELAAGPAV